MTDTKVRSARPRETPYKLVDGDGLTLLVNPNGSRWWRLRYRFGGREKMLSVGVYPGVPLKQARDKSDSISQDDCERRRLEREKGSGEKGASGYPV